MIAKMVDCSDHDAQYGILSVDNISLEEVQNKIYEIKFIKPCHIDEGTEIYEYWKKGLEDIEAAFAMLPESMSEIFIKSAKISLVQPIQMWRENNV